MSAAKPAAPARRPGSTVAAFVLGLPLAAAVYAAYHHGLISDPALERYLHHPVEWVEITLFCCALGALAGKAMRLGRERWAARAALLPTWDGRPVPVEEAPKLLGRFLQHPRRLRDTWAGRRVAAVLDFLHQRKSANGLDDQMRALADADALAMEGSFSLTRFIVWAIPILGFLGTVLGITQAIAGVSPEQLEKDISGVTGGLATAFDTTALALALTMAVMLLTFLVERGEQVVLDRVDELIDRDLAHRFVRQTADSGPFAEAVRQQSGAMLAAVEQAVQKQAEVWARTFAQTEERSRRDAQEQQERLAGAIQSALEATLDSQAARLAALEQQTLQQTTKLFEHLAMLAESVRRAGQEQAGALGRVGEAVARQASVLAEVQAGEKQLVQLQAALHQNLAALSGSGAFEQAVHTLTAAVHLLTARAAAQPATLVPPRAQPGKAA